MSSVVIDLQTGKDLAWDSDLQPRNWGSGRTSDVETFPNWWARVGSRLSNLEPRIAEQWVYRHWRFSLYRHLPLEGIQWKLEEWKTTDILKQCVESPECDLDDPDNALEQISCYPGEPARTMDATGTWNIPIIIMHTPDGVLANNGVRDEVRYWLIEGHTRVRYLNALHVIGQESGIHQVFVLTMNECNTLFPQRAENGSFIR